MTPLRTIHLAGYPQRINASPLTVPDHPWASFHDLMTLAEMPGDTWRRAVREAELRNIPNLRGKTVLQ